MTEISIVRLFDGTISISVSNNARIQHVYYCAEEDAPEILKDCMRDLTHQPMPQRGLWHGAPVHFTAREIDSSRWVAQEMRAELLKNITENIEAVSCSHWGMFQCPTCL